SVQTATYFMAESAFTAELRSSFQPLSAIFERELQAIREGAVLNGYSLPGDWGESVSFRGIWSDLIDPYPQKCSRANALLLAMAESDDVIPAERLKQVVNVFIAARLNCQELVCPADDSFIAGPRTQGLNLTAELYLRAFKRRERGTGNAWNLAEYLHNDKKYYADPYNSESSVAKFADLYAGMHPLHRDSKDWQVEVDYVNRAINLRLAIINGDIPAGRGMVAGLEDLMPRCEDMPRYAVVFAAVVTITGALVSAYVAGRG
ncbi:MAG: hypothetical protein Q7V63_08365, partial [Gammaproteobacteria bacterium]|nr:hypothetical protein [Gammaproteobacteria bacterium]